MIAWSSDRDGLKLSHSSIFTNKTYFLYVLTTDKWMDVFFFLVSFSLLQCFLAFSLWSIDRLLTISLHPSTLSTQTMERDFCYCTISGRSVQTPNFLVLTSNFTVNFMNTLEYLPNRFLILSTPYRSQLLTITRLISPLKNAWKMIFSLNTFF